MSASRWPQQCMCVPGSEADGWREVRSAECLAVERALWTEAMDRLHEMIEEMKRSDSATSLVLEEYQREFARRREVQR